MTPPTSSNPLLQALARSKAKAPQSLSGVASLADYPALALAGASGDGRLDVKGEAFAAVISCLETVTRLRLGSRNGLALAILCQSGPLTAGNLASRLWISPAAMTSNLRRLESLGLVTVARNHGDRREVIVRATPSARSVLANIVALTALGQAANVLTKVGHLAKGQDRQRVAFSA